MPTLTSHDRQYQLSTLAQVGSELTFCQFKIVRTMQHAAVLHQIKCCVSSLYGQKLPWTHKRPRLMRKHRPALIRNSIWTFQKITMGNNARTKSDMMEMMACEMMILWSWASVKHFAGLILSQEPAIGLHWNIHSRVRTTFVTIKKAIAPWSGRTINFSTGIRRRRIQMEILVNIKV